YEDVIVSQQKVKEYSKVITDLLDKANKSGKLTKEILNSLKKTGKLFYDEILSANFREKLDKTTRVNLILNVEDSLVHIPWELMYDGKEFLCQRFNMGRVVTTRQDFTPRQREVAIPLKMLLLSDPQGNLPYSALEGKNLNEILLKREDTINVTFKGTETTTDYLNTALNYFDIFHYAGHTEYNAENSALSGLMLKDGKFTAGDVKKVGETRLLPALVFLNSCHSGRTEEWVSGEGLINKGLTREGLVSEGLANVFGIGNAFLLAGVQHFLGTFWEVRDEAAGRFALEFYDELIKGETIGQAVRMARQKMIDAYGEESIVWAGFMLYGDPTVRYIGQSDELPVKKTKSEQDSTRATEETNHTSSSATSSQPIISIPPPAQRVPRWQIVTLATVVILVIIAVLLRFNIFNKQGESSKQIIMEQADRPAPQPKSLANNQVQDQAKDKDNKEIDALVAELVKRYKENKFTPDVKRDEWTSRPVSLVFLDVKYTGLSDIERERLLNGAFSNMQNDGRVKVVDRAILDRLFKELKLGSSELADPSTALKIGKLLSARLIVTGSVMKDKKDWLITLRMVEIETSSIKGALSLDCTSCNPSSLAEKLSVAILKKIKSEYPIQTKVSSVEGDAVVVEAGAKEGVIQGMKMAVFTEKNFESGIESGILEIVKVGASSSMAKVMQKGSDMKTGMRAREVQAKEVQAKEVQK
ncbi:MAG: CHAT domain-containing protein, partial [Nitrospirae bacterium]|nr:CHAT domain-containing protein [Nitrospirota bacterium]